MKKKPNTRFAQIIEAQRLRGKTYKIIADALGVCVDTLKEQMQYNFPPNLQAESLEVLTKMAGWSSVGSFIDYLRGPDTKKASTEEKASYDDCMKNSLEASKGENPDFEAWDYWAGAAAAKATDTNSRALAINRRAAALDQKGEFVLARTLLVQQLNQSGLTDITRIRLASSLAYFELILENPLYAKMLADVVITLGGTPPLRDSLQPGDSEPRRHTAVAVAAGANARALYYLEMANKGPASSRKENAENAIRDFALTTKLLNDILEEFPDGLWAHNMREVAWGGTVAAKVAAEIIEANAAVEMLLANLKEQPNESGWLESSAWKAIFGCEIEIRYRLSSRKGHRLNDFIDIAEPICREMKQWRLWHRFLEVDFIRRRLLEDEGFRNVAWTIDDEQRVAIHGVMGIWSSFIGKGSEWLEKAAA